MRGLFQLPMALENGALGLFQQPGHPLECQFLVHWGKSALQGVLEDNGNPLLLPVYQTPFLAGSCSRGILASTIGLLLLRSPWPQVLPFDPYCFSPGTQGQLPPISPFLTVSTTINVAEFETLHILTAVEPGLCLNPPSEKSQTPLFSE